MNSESDYARSPELMSAADTALLVVDVQEKLIPLIPGWQRIVWNIRRLIDGAKLLSLPVLATEQYPRGLGPMLPELAERIGGEIPEKTIFSSCGCEQLLAELDGNRFHRVLLAGIEAHVCVAQTGYDLMAEGFHVYLAVDAIGARFDIDREIAIRRLDSAGVTITTTEAALFEWCEKSGTPEFKQISALVKEPPPGL